MKNDLIKFCVQLDGNGLDSSFDDVVKIFGECEGVVTGISPIDAFWMVPKDKTDKCRQMLHGKILFAEIHHGE